MDATTETGNKSPNHLLTVTGRNLVSWSIKSCQSLECLKKNGNDAQQWRNKLPVRNESLLNHKPDQNAKLKDFLCYIL